mgnify:CR=1 FL=1
MLFRSGGALASGIGTSDAGTLSGTPLVTSPTEASTVSGRITLKSDGGRTASSSPQSVKFAVDGLSVGQASWNGTAYILSWDSATVADGAHSITAIAKTRYRNVTGPPVNVVVSQVPTTTTTTTTTTPPLAPVTTTTTVPPVTTTAQPPAAVPGGVAWDQMFGDDFSDPARTAALWSTGMRNGAKTLEGNTELQWYDPANSVVTTDTDNGSTIGVLRQSRSEEHTSELQSH